MSTDSQQPASKLLKYSYSYSHHGSQDDSYGFHFAFEDMNTFWRRLDKHRQATAERAGWADL
uniref:Uncharacterized protein n=1 Tax=Solanum lycopersicum TaxID=4081 RepID=A0A3Q7FZ13_SOLLC